MTATDWRQYYKVQQPTITEPPEMKEARVLKMIGVMVQQNGDTLSAPVQKKLHKVLNARLISIMNEVRDVQE
jgi:hypothetical protein